jgi:hypothetical protein
MGFVPSLFSEKIAVVSRHSAIQAHAGKRSGQHTKVYNVMGFMRTHCGVSHRNQSQLKGIYMMQTTMGNGFVVVQPHNSFDLWCKNVADGTPFYFWRNTPTNHIWEKTDIKDVPSWVINEFVKAMKGD